MLISPRSQRGAVESREEGTYMPEDKRYADLADRAFSAAKRKNGKKSPVEKLLARLEAAAQADDEGNEYWFARDLQTILDYSKWGNFLEVVEKAKIACNQAGYRASHHFGDVTKMVSIGSGAGRPVEDIALSRYACYLIAQNGDSRKQSIAFAQTYFAVQARRQELRDKEEADLPLSEDEKRVLLRGEIKEHNKKLAGVAKSAGVQQGMEFAVFQTHGYKGLYGGLDVPGIRKKKGLKSKQQILDHMGSTELAANLFRATQTEEKLRRENIQGKDQANKAHFEVGRKVRHTIRELGGDMPETLPIAEDVKKIARRLDKALPQIKPQDKAKSRQI